MITFGSEGAAWFDFKSRTGDHVQDRVCFVYRAGSIENDHKRSIAGTAFGFLSCIAACIACAATKEKAAGIGEGYAEAIEAGLSCMNDLLEKGHGPVLEIPNGFPTSRLVGALNSPDICCTKANHTLTEATMALENSGATFLALMGLDKASEAMHLASLAVVNGPLAIENLPHLRMGKLLTADPSEVEALRILTQVVRRYKDHDDGKKPLSIGVFGPPGAGKSFAVKQLAEAFLGKQGEWLEFNLSQFPSAEELNGAFHQIRDTVLQGKLPIAFFDEFDSQRYKWLQYLLAPMQDGRFQQGEVTHTLGKCILIFAGGTSWTFETFGPPEPKLGGSQELDTIRNFDEFRLAKGPDFKSRLDAFLNVVGPNRRPKLATNEPDAECFLVSGRKMTEDKEDVWFPIRRALMIRSELKLPVDSNLNIDQGLLHALLSVGRYKNGSRSLSKVVSPLIAGLPNRLETSSLPPRAQIDMFCDVEEFSRLCGEQPERVLNVRKLEKELIDAIAPVVHNIYRELGRQSGWLKPKDDLDLGPFAFVEGNEVKAESNFAAAERIPRVLAVAGLDVVVGAYSSDSEEQSVRQQLEYHLELLAKAEHQEWMNWYLSKGWTYHPKRDDDRKRHNCLQPFSDLKEEDRTKDRQQVRHYPEFLRAVGLKIVPRS